MDGVGALIGAIKQTGAGGGEVQPIWLGTVVSVHPLSVRMGQLLLDAGALKVDPRCVYVPKKNEPANPHLIATGDEVLLATADGQTFVVICKVVRG